MLTSVTCVKLKKLKKNVTTNIRQGITLHHFIGRRDSNTCSKWPHLCRLELQFYSTSKSGWKIYIDIYP
jgi:hypothetical protein